MKCSLGKRKQRAFVEQTRTGEYICIAAKQLYNTGLELGTCLRSEKKG